MLSATQIVNLQDHETRVGHLAEPQSSATSPPEPASLASEASGWLEAVGRQHRANFELWHIEDEARAPGATEPNWPR